MIKCSYLIVLILALQNWSLDIQKDEVKYVFYLHGKIVEDQGQLAFSKQHGNYEYVAILEALDEEDVQVLSELRPKDTPIVAYARKIAEQIESLIDKGTPPSHISVIGASKGALIAMQVSSILQNEDVRFVFLAGYIESAIEYYEFDLYGKVLCIYELSDPIAGSSYQPLIDRSKGISQYKEITLNTGLEHGIVFKPLIEWLAPTKEWIN